MQKNFKFVSHDSCVSKSNLIYIEKLGEKFFKLNGIYIRWNWYTVYETYLSRCMYQSLSLIVILALMFKYVTVKWQRDLIVK